MVGHRIRGWLATLLLWLPASALPAEPLVFVSLPMENPRSTVAHSQALAAYLEKLHGGPVTIRHLADYGDILRAFLADEIDLLQLGPLPLFQLQQRTSEAVSVAAFRESDGGTRYTCVLAAPADQSLQLGTLDARQPPARIVLTQPMSTCGYLSSAWLLQQAGARIDAAQAIYLGSHEAVALALVRGESTLGGLKQTIAARYAQLGVHVIAETDPLPGFVLVANGRTLTGTQIERLRAGLLDADADVLAGLELGRFGFAPVEDGFLAPIMRMVRDTGFVVPVEAGF